MDSFIKELEIGEIHLRDRWQFELKSEFFPLPELKNNVYTQEFYLFIPNSLQVSEDTYSNTQFYQDQTNLIRYKTPQFQLKEILDQKNKKSPLSRLAMLNKEEPKDFLLPVVEDEIKLLGNSIRSSLRERVRVLLRRAKKAKAKDKENTLLSEVTLLCEEIAQLRERYTQVQTSFLDKWDSDDIKSCFLYLDEFITNCIDYYLTGLMEHLRKIELSNSGQFDSVICDLLAQEKRYRKKNLPRLKITDEDSINNEYVLYRSGLLNKFVHNALLLNTTKSSLVKKYRNVIGSISAGIAMLFFFVFFLWQGEIFLINSIPFILITVFLYIIKDRMKEGLKNISYQQFSKWFSDYITEIRSPDGTLVLGKMTESFSFVKEQKLPRDIMRIRHREFHMVLEQFKRLEQVIYYKKKISIFRSEKPVDVRRQALNIISRFNISQFVKKADNPSQTYATVEPKTREIKRKHLPKVYHLNIIIKNSYKKDGLSSEIVELKKFRVILDKNGIKRIEQVRPPLLYQNNFKKIAKFNSGPEPAGML